jgi:hypothetical protein
MKYTACYCEENIWHLCADPAVTDNDADIRVVWVSSLHQVCPIWCQRTAPGADEPVWWDYHVFLLSHKSGNWLVWDLDTSLGLPVAAQTYFARAFKQPMPLHPVFRVMDADYYRREFSSDRSHMQGPDGKWMSPPPEWPAVVRDDLTFAAMRDMHDNRHGERLSLDEMERLVSGPIRHQP